MREPRIINAAAADGCPIVRIEIARRPGVFATVDAADYEAWVAAGLSVRWNLNRNGSGTYRVCFSRRDVRGRNASVARQLLDPGFGRIVRYRDRDCLNLRRGNLEVTNGTARGQTLVVSDV